MVLKSLVQVSKNANRKADAGSSRLDVHKSLVCYSYSNGKTFIIDRAQTSACSITELPLRLFALGKYIHNLSTFKCDFE